MMFEIPRSVQSDRSHKQTVTRRRLGVIAGFCAASATVLGLGLNHDEPEATASTLVVAPSTSTNDVECLIVGAENVTATGGPETMGEGSAIVSNTEGINWHSTCYDEALVWTLEQNDAFHNLPGENLVVPEAVIKVERSEG